ncbi:hypothetical protein BBJ28_00021452 [Nothophytophthora sp. Chile5]|nr:hypothetical protein BBJ28_00021452 [Nothophytophthora sp. Chile5]
MLPVSGKDVRRLRFGLVYGPKRKCVRFRAPNAAAYDAWEMILEAAVEKAATERPTFPTWSCQCTSPSLSVDAGYVSEEFGFISESGRESEDDTAENDSKANLHTADLHNPLTGSFVDFIDSASSESSANEADGELPQLDTIHSECEAPLGSFDRSILAMYRRMSRQSREKRSKSKRKEQEATAPQCLEVALHPETPCAQQSFPLYQPLGIQAARDTVVEYLSWLRRGFQRGRENHNKDTRQLGTAASIHAI